jgi:hypothetical protein
VIIAFVPLAGEGNCIVKVPDETDCAPPENAITATIGFPLCEASYIIAPSAENVAPLHEGLVHVIHPPLVSDPDEYPARVAPPVVYPLPFATSPEV